MLKKDIIVITNYIANGGAQRVISELSNEWYNKGHKVTIVQTMPEYNINGYKLQKNIEIISIYSKKNRIIDFFYKVVKIYSFIKTRKNATVLNFLNMNLLIVSICSIFLKNKFVFAERCSPERTPHSVLKRFFRNILFHFADICVFQTNDAKYYFPKIIQSRSFVIPNPISPNLPEPYIGKRQNIIVAVGRLHKQKNFPMLIKAFSRFIKEYPNFKLNIYGDGEDKNKIQKLIEAYSLTNEVSLKGFCKNIFDEIKDSAIYVSSSDYEGISNSMLEALGIGLPVISTDCPAGGARLAIENGVNGLLIPVGNEESLYIAMKRIVEEKGLSEKLSLEAVKIREKFPVEKIASQWLKIFT